MGLAFDIWSQRSDSVPFRHTSQVQWPAVKVFWVRNSIEFVSIRLVSVVTYSVRGPRHHALAWSIEKQRMCGLHVWGRVYENIQIIGTILLDEAGEVDVLRKLHMNRIQFSTTLGFSSCNTGWKTPIHFTTPALIYFLFQVTTLRSLVSLGVCIEWIHFRIC